MTCYYAIMETIDRNTVRVTRLEAGVRGKKIGTVEYLEPGSFRACRLYATFQVKEFSVDHDPFLGTELTVARAALKWACEAHVVSDVRSKKPDGK